MFLQRLATALRRQDWIVITIEFLLVISGVLIALQFDQIREDRALNALEVKHLEAVRVDIETNILDLEKTEKELRVVIAFGYEVLELIEEKRCAENCWPELLSFFQATQWIDAELKSTAFDEMKRAGFPRDAELRDW